MSAMISFGLTLILAMMALTIPAKSTVQYCDASPTSSLSSGSPVQQTCIDQALVISSTHECFIDQKCQDLLSKMDSCFGNLSPAISLSDNITSISACMCSDYVFNLNQPWSNCQKCMDSMHETTGLPSSLTASVDCVAGNWITFCGHETYDNLNTVLTCWDQFASQWGQFASNSTNPTPALYAPSLDNASDTAAAGGSSTPSTLGSLQTSFTTTITITETVVRPTSSQMGSGTITASLGTLPVSLVMDTNTPVRTVTVQVTPTLVSTTTHSLIPWVNKNAGPAATTMPDILTPALVLFCVLLDDF